VKTVISERVFQSVVYRLHSLWCAAGSAQDWGRAKA